LLVVSCWARFRLWLAVVIQLPAIGFQSRVAGCQLVDGEAAVEVDDEVVAGNLHGVDLHFVEL
jgi:hypothetical protein